MTCFKDAKLYCGNTHFVSMGNCFYKKGALQFSSFCNAPLAGLFIVLLIQNPEKSILPVLLRCLCGGHHSQGRLAQVVHHRDSIPRMLVYIQQNAATTNSSLCYYIHPPKLARKIPTIQHHRYSTPVQKHILLDR